MHPGELIKKLREKNKLTQIQLAEKMGMNNSVLSRIESGKRPIEDTELSKFADFFEVKVDYLLGRTEDSTPSSPSASTLTEKDKRDIAKRLEEIRRDVSSGEGLAFDGEPLSPEAQESFLDAMEYILNTTKKINKKYTPKKYRNDANSE